MKYLFPQNYQERNSAPYFTDGIDTRKLTVHQDHNVILSLDPDSHFYAPSMNSFIQEEVRAALAQPVSSSCAWNHDIQEQTLLPLADPRIALTAHSLPHSELT